MYCPKCGTENPEIAVYCKNCGNKIEIITEPASNLNTHEKPKYKTSYENELNILKEKIINAQDINELDYLRRTNEKRYWWTSIFVCALFYGLNGKILKMLLSWIISVFTLGIYSLYVIYTSYKDKKVFNDEMEWYILNRKRELN